MFQGALNVFGYPGVSEDKKVGLGDRDTSKKNEQEHTQKKITKSSLVSPKLTRPTLFYVHCVPQEGGRMQGWESVC